MNNLNKKADLNIENGLTIGAIIFIMLTGLLLFISFKLKIPFSNDIKWSDANVLKMSGYCFLATIGFKTETWLLISQSLEISRVKTLFLVHFYFPFLVSLPLSIFVGFICAKPIDIYQARGQHLLSFEDAIKYARKREKNNKRKNKNNDFQNGVLIHHQIRLSQNVETKGIAMLGSPGAGKTQIIKQMICDIFENQSNPKFMILDNKGDFTEFFDDNQSIILAPWDQRGARWDIGNDVSNAADAQLFASSLIAKSGGDNSVFADAARVVLAGFVTCLQQKHDKNWGFSELVNCLEWSREQTISEFQKYYKIGLQIVREDSKTTDSVYFTLISNLSFLNEIAALYSCATTSFSLKNWIADESNEKPVVILQVDKSNPLLSDSYCCAILDIASSLILSPNFQDSYFRRLHFVLDEIAQIPKIQQLGSLVALGRAKGVCVYLGIQDFDLLVKIYGKEDVNALISQMQTKIILKTGAGADFASKIIGDREIYVQDFDDKTGKRSPQTATQRIVSSSEISGIQDLQGWITSTDFDAILRLNFRYVEFEKQRDAVIIRNFAEQQANVISTKKRLIKKSDVK